MDVRKFLETASHEELRNQFESWAADSSDDSIELMKETLKFKVGETYLKHEVPRLAAAALVKRGEKGIRALAEVFPLAPGSIYPTTILATLFRVANYKQPTKAFALFSDELFVVPDERVSRLAWDELRRIVAASADDGELFYQIVTMLYQVSIPAIAEADREWIGRSFAKIITAGTIKISSSLVNEYRRLLEMEGREEIVQKFLRDNPVFIDPLAKEVLSKKKLGNDLITDFVISRFDSKYVVVEIEKPQTPIFTLADNFTAEFTHAFGQVLDFQSWIRDNISYAQKLMPDISNPRGMLIIGLTDKLSVKQKAKLSMFCQSLHNIEILGFDDLHRKANSLLENIFHKGT